MFWLLVTVLLLSPVLMAIFIGLYIAERNKNIKLKKQISLYEEAARTGAPIVLVNNPVKPAPPVTPIVPAPVQVQRPVGAVAPTPVQQAPVKSAYVPAPQAVREKPRKKNTTVNVILIIGVLFIVLAGFVFMTTTWNVLSDIVRVVVLLLMSGVFFGGSLVAEKFLDLKKTGFAFFCLGSIFLPASFFACGIFKLFGEAFTPYPDNPMNPLFYLVTFLLVTVTMTTGSVRYSSKFYSWAAYTAKTLSYISLVNLVFTAPGVRALALSVYAAIIVFLNGKPISAAKEKFPKLSALLSQYGMFSIINISAVALIALFTFENSLVSALSLFIIAGSFLFNTFNGKYPVGAVVFVPFVVIGFTRMNFLSGGWDSLTFKIALSCIACLAVSMMGFVKERRGNFIRLCTGIVSIVLIGFCIAGNVVGEVDLPLLISSAVVYFTLVFAGRNKESSFLNHIHPFALLLLGIEIHFYIVNLIAPAAYLYSSVSLVLTSAAGLLLYNFVKSERLKLSLHTITSDVAFLFAAFISIFMSGEYLIGLLSVAILIAEAIFSVVRSKTKAETCVAAVFLPLGLIAASPLLNFVGDEIQISAYLVSLGIGLALTAIAGLAEKRGTEKSKTLSLIFQSLMPFYILLHYMYIFTSENMLFDGKERNYALLEAGLFAVGLCFAAEMLVRYIKKSRAASKPSEAITIYLISAVLMFSFVLAYVVDFMMIDGYIIGGAFAIAVLTITALFADKIIPSRDSVSEFIKNRFSTIMLVASTVSSVITGIITASALSYEMDSKLLSNPLLPYCTETISALICWTAVSIASFALFRKNKRTLWSLPLAISSCAAVYKLSALLIALIPYERTNIANLENERAVALVLTAVIMTVLSYAFFPKLYEKASSGKNPYVDWLLPSVIIPVAMLLDCYCSILAEYPRYALIFVFIAYPLTFVGKLYSVTLKQIAFTVSLLPACMLFWTQPFAEIPGFASMEFNMLPIVLVLTALWYIWKNHRKPVGIISFAAAVIMLLTLFIDGMNSGETFDALFLGIAAFVMLLLSLWRKKKKWFMLSAVALVALGVYMTYAYWGAMYWWVYLAVIGVVLIVLAAINETSKRDGKETLVKKVGRVFSGWEW